MSPPPTFTSTMAISLPLASCHRTLKIVIIAAFLVASSFSITLNTMQDSARAATLLEDLPKSNVDTSDYHSSVPISGLSSPSSPSSLLSPSPSPYPSTSITPGTANNVNTEQTLTTQAALGSVTSKQTNNIVNTLSYYDIVFTTTTSGSIKTINVIFPDGTQIGTTNLLVERDGIGPGTAAKTGTNRITYTVDNAVNVPAGTNIRLEFSPLSNPSNPAADYQVTVTTRNSAGNIIDGPTNSLAYNIKRINTNDIGDNAVTSNKISENFMLSRLLMDDARGHSFGWNPDGTETNFIIIDDTAISDSNAVLINVGDSASNSQCESLGSLVGFFTIQCAAPPPQASELRYTIINLPLS